MSKFGKSCFECAKKTNSLVCGRCYDCHKKSNPPIKEIKRVNFKICNQCGKIHFNNSLYLLDEIREMLPDIMRKRIVLNAGYMLKDVSIRDFWLDGNKLVFKVGIEAKIDEI